jgi:hemerythrin-like domain-containing protein
MKPRGQLMIEHRLIEKVLTIANNKAITMSKDNFSPLFVDKIVDFIIVYADRTHHGKEKDILFMELGKKNMDFENVKIMNELIDEHKQARAKVKEIIDYNMQFKSGNTEVVSKIAQIIVWLANFYPVHIIKEDKVFFPNSEKYFDDGELVKMQEKFDDFDRNMIHEKYKHVYEDLVNN